VGHPKTADPSVGPGTHPVLGRDDTSKSPPRQKKAECGTRKLQIPQSDRVLTRSSVGMTHQDPHPGKRRRNGAPETADPSVGPGTHPVLGRDDTSKSPSRQKKAECGTRKLQIPQSDRVLTRSSVGMTHQEIPTPPNEGGMGHPKIPTPPKEGGMGHPSSRRRSAGRSEPWLWRPLLRDSWARR
jgi:hypothetical protein